ncbi:MAG: hypothetical protein R3A79_16035 [Nannocystaceae bacterium]
MAAEDTRLRIAVDAMGGDRAPVEPIRAAARISRETTLDLLLVGKREVIAAELGRVDHRPAQLEIVDARGDRDG